jgi:DNA-directed RNA polymerase specialized sigma24 family protein
MQQPSSSGGNDAPNPLFPDTLWPVVLEAKASDPDKARAALTELCVIYREPIEKWLKSNGHKEDAEDLTSAFILHWQKKNLLDDFEPRANTKFRSFLLTCLRGIVNDERKLNIAVKRNKGLEPVPLEDHDVPDESDMARKLDQGLAMTVHKGALAALAKQDKGRLDELRRFLPPLDLDASYSEAAARLKLSENTLKVAVSRLREKYYDAFRAEVTRIARADELDEEMQYLMGLVS